MGFLEESRSPAKPLGRHFGGARRLCCRTLRQVHVSFLRGSVKFTSMPRRRVPAREGNSFHEKEMKRDCYFGSRVPAALALTQWSHNQAPV